MYLRFITQFVNEWNEEKTGVFQALGYLIRSNEVFEHDLAKLNEIRNWFDYELDRPKRFNKQSQKNKRNVAISWFKDSAKLHLRKMYDLVPIFEYYGIQINVVKKKNPGYIIYEDEFQVVTIPHGKDKKEVL